MVLSFFYHQRQASRTRGGLLTTFVLINTPGRIHEPPPRYVSQLFTASLAETGRYRSVLEGDRDRIRPRLPPLEIRPGKPTIQQFFQARIRLIFVKITKLFEYSMRVDSISYRESTNSCHPGKWSPE